MADIHFNGVIFTRAWYLMLEDERLRTVSRDNWGVIYYNSLIISAPLPLFGNPGRR